jgi:transcriptional regulator
LRKTGSHRVLEQLAAKFESGRPDPWQLDRLEREYYAEQLREIVAFEFRVERLTAKAKLSQNRTAADRERVIAALCASADPLDRDTADAMERTTE